MPIFQSKLPKLNTRRRRRVVGSRITPQISHAETVDLVFEIPDIVIGTAYPDVIDLEFQLFSPTLVLGSYILEAVVIDIGVEIPTFNTVAIMTVIDIVFEITSTTTYYPILLTADVVDLEFSIEPFHKAIRTTVTDLSFEIMLPTVYMAGAAEVIDLEFEIPDPVIIISGFFFCIDAGFVTAPGCEEGLILDATVANGKINCGD